MAAFERMATISVQAGAAVPIYRFVQLQSTGKYILVGVAQARADGVSAQAASADGKTFAMEPLPSSALAKVEAGAAIAVGAQVASDASGRAITAVSTAGNYILGVCRKAAAGVGEIIEVQLAQHQDGA